MGINQSHVSRDGQMAPCFSHPVITAEELDNHSKQFKNLHYLVEARPGDIKSQGSGLVDEGHRLPETLLVEEPFSALVKQLKSKVL